MFMFGQQCTASSSPLRFCTIRRKPSSYPKFHHPLTIGGVGRSTKALSAILTRGCHFRGGGFIH